MLHTIYMNTYSYSKYIANFGRNFFEALNQISAFHNKDFSILKRFRKFNAKILKTAEILKKSYGIDYANVAN